MVACIILNNLDLWHAFRNRVIALLYLKVLAPLPEALMDPRLSKFVVENCLEVVRDVGIGAVEKLRQSRTVSGLYTVSFLVVVGASMRLTPEGHELLLSAVYIRYRSKVCRYITLPVHHIARSRYLRNSGVAFPYHKTCFESVKSKWGRSFNVNHACVKLSVASTKPISAM